jgi:hypothetical protein
MADEWAGREEHKSAVGKVQRCVTWQQTHTELCTGALSQGRRYLPGPYLLSAVNIPPHQQVQYSEVDRHLATITRRGKALLSEVSC